MLAFALSTTLLTTFLFGLSRPGKRPASVCSPALSRINARTTTARVHIGRSLVVAQFALSLVLVAGAVLLLRTLLNLTQVDTGFDRDRVLLVQHRSRRNRL